MEFSLVSFLLGLLVVVLTSWGLKVYLDFVWRPQKFVKWFDKQGIRGPPGDLFQGNLKEIALMDKEARAMTIESPYCHDIIQRVLPFYHHWSQQYGEMFIDFAGPNARLWVADADMVKEITYNKTEDYPKISTTSPSFKALLGKGLVFINGGEWARHRKVVSPAFHIDKLKGMTKTMAEVTKSRLDSWGNERRELEVHEEIKELTSDIISHTAFGSSYAEGKEVFQIQNEMIQIALQTLYNLVTPVLRYLPTAANRRVWALEKQADKALESIINLRMDAAKETGSFGEDLLGIMLESSRSEATTHSNNKIQLTLSIDEIKHECMTFFFAGQDTTSNLLSWSMFLLSIYPDWQNKLRDEVMSVYGREIPDADSHGKLKLVNMVLMESLRLYPPVVELFRVVSKDLKLGNVTVPKDIAVRIPILALHRNKDYWGDDAYEFNPSRFADGFARAAKHPSAMMPFSAGQRNCVGQNFAMLEARLVLAMILQRFSFSLSPNYKHAPVKNITLQPQFGLPLILEPLLA